MPSTPTRSPQRFLLAVLAVLSSASGAGATAANVNAIMCDSAARAAPSVTTLMAAPVNGSDHAWILQPNCSLEIMKLALFDPDYRSKLNCSQKGIGRIESLPRNVQRLILDGNAVTEADLTNYTFLLEISLARSGLTSVDGFKFPTTLRKLDLTGNPLKGTAKGAIPDHVETLYLGRSDLDSIENFTLPSSLTELYLNGSNFSSINFALPNGLDKLDMSDNRQLRSIENLTMPNTLNTLSCVNCAVESIRGVQFSKYLRTLNLTGSNVTKFEIRQSDHSILERVDFRGEVFSRNCSFSPGSTLLKVASTNDYPVCGISDTAFEAKYPDRLRPPTDTTTRPSSRDTPSTTLPSQPLGSSSSSINVIIIACVVATIAIASILYRKWATKKRSKQDNGDTSLLDAPGSTAATGWSGTTPSYASHEYLSNDIRNDPTLITRRIAYNEIEILREIARGGFGVIHLGKFRGREVAVKQILPEKAKDMNVIRSFMDEIRLCASLEHPRIVAFLGVSWSTLQDVAVVIEFMGGGDLHAVLRAQRSPRATSWFEPSPDLKAKSLLALDVADALVYLHSFEQPIIHRDLKTRNVLLNDVGDAKLSDFGISREAALDETMTGEIGTVAWIAPEVLRGERYSEKADIYSLGVLLVELDKASHPYRKELSESEAMPQSNTRIALLVSTGKLSPSTSLECPSDVAALVSRCLSFAPTDRPTAMDVHYELRKIWQQRENN